MSDEKTGSTGSREVLGERPLDELGWEGGPEFLGRDLLACFVGYVGNPTSALAAFQALARIAQHWDDPSVEAPRGDKNFGIPPHHTVHVPWWVVKVLGLLWHRYSTQEEPSSPLGQVFGIEGKGRGARGAQRLFETQHKRMLIALEVYHRLARAEAGTEITTSNAVRQTARDHNLSEDLVWSAWHEHQKRVRQAVGNWEAYGKRSRSS